MNRFSIRPARPSDAPALAEIYRYYVENTAVSYECAAPDAREFARRIESTLIHYPYYVAEDALGLLGYAYAGPFSPRAAADWTAEASIYVHRERRRSGVGSALYQKLEETMQAQNFQSLVVKIACCSRDDDPYLSHDSIDFHTRCGYQIIGTVENCGYKFGRWYGLLFMQKQLGAFPESAPPILPFSQLSL